MKINFDTSEVTAYIPWPYRFKTYEDAVLFMECAENKTEFPADKIVLPYVTKGGVSDINPDYDLSPYELRYIVTKHKPSEIVDA